MKVCDECGAHLDPCEVCDCQDKEKAAPGGGTSKSGSDQRQG